MLEMRLINSPDEIKAVAALAEEIWIGHFTPIIGRAQVDYMLAEFQSAKAISIQISHGYQYYIVEKDQVAAGYFAIVAHPLDASVQLSKIYILERFRRQNLGAEVIFFAERQCCAMKASTLWLTVNRNNSGPITFYQNMGFTNSGPIVQDIGSGFVMDDYKMVKQVGGTSAGCD